MNSHLRGSVVCKCELWVPHHIEKVKVEHLISKRTHKPIALRFWVRVWHLSCLCGCSNLDVDSPLRSSHDPTVVSEPRFDEGYDRGNQSVCAESSNDGTGSVGPFAEKPATTIQESKSRASAWRGSMMNWWTHTWGGVLCASVSYMSHIG